MIIMENVNEAVSPNVPSPFFKSLTNQLEHFFNSIYLFFLTNIRFIKYLCLALSLSFSIFRAVFYHGFNVDGYVPFAESLNIFLITGEKTYVFLNFKAKYRIIYPLIVALLHVVVPIDFAILAAILNVISYLGTLFVFQKILTLLDFKEKIIHLYQVLLMMSYNYLNYWFNVLTEGLGLLLFLLFLWFLILFIQQHKVKYLPISFLFFLLSIYTREIFVLGLPLYIFILPKWKYRMLLSSLAVACIISFIAFFPQEFSQLDNYFGGIFRSELIQRNEFHEIFQQLQWDEMSYIFIYFKGLIKVGIIPAFLAASIFFVVNRFSHMNTKNNNKNTTNRKERKKKRNPQKITAFYAFFLLWFCTYKIFYSLFFGYVEIASGLRYWFPISWIPFLFTIHSLQNLKMKQFNLLKISLISILVLFPLFWSTGEIYLNREDPTGTGSLLYPTSYFNDLLNKESISEIDPKNFTYEIEENDFLSLQLDNLDFVNQSTTCRVRFKMWIENAKNFTVLLRVKANSKILSSRFFMYEVKPDYAPGFGNVTIIQEIANITSEFQVFQFQYDAVFHLRELHLEVRGYDGAQFALDKILITADTADIDINNLEENNWQAFNPYASKYFIGASIAFISGILICIISVIYKYIKFRLASVITE